MDLVTRNGDRSVTHTWLVNGRRSGQTKLGGPVTAVSIASLGDGTLDVLALGPDGGARRRHFDGKAWSRAWQRLDGGPFTSAIGMSARSATKSILITARGTTGTTYERTLTPTSSGTGWRRVPGQLWSGRALGDRYPGRPTVGVSRTYDGFARWQRGAMTMVLDQPIYSAPEVVTRPDGSWLMFARNRSGGLSVYDARPGAYVVRDLGGLVK